MAADRITLDNMIQEQENEIFVADEYFRRQVAAGKLPQGRADHRMACKRAILQALRDKRDSQAQQEAA